jgi:hypothetical protein
VQVDKSETMDACLAALRSLRKLQVLSITVASFILDDRQMAALGGMPLADLRLVSQVHAPLILPLFQVAALQTSLHCSCQHVLEHIL